MDLTWLGTAGFIVKSKQGEIVFDPFLTRGQGAPSPFGVKSFENANALFVGHGHFDHTFDVPRIAAGTDFKIFAPGLTGKMLSMRGVPSDRLLPATRGEMLFKDFKVRAFRSSHVNFDWPLVVSTVKRCGVGGCLHMLPLGVGYPVGMVQTYLFEVEGKKVLFISSAGCSREELEEYRKLEVDYLLAPLQGHSRIQAIAAEQTAIINPKVVIPHHHDDFYPPLSQEISVGLFREQLKLKGYRGDFVEIPLFKSALV